MRFLKVYLLKILIVISSLGGVLISLLTAQQEGYSHWHKSLLYFTGQSNLWIGLTTLALLITLLFFRRKIKVVRALYFLKFVFTVSITVTAIVFFCFLAPFADESYHIWSVSGFLTHLFSPLFSVIDLFTDDYKLKLKSKIVFASIIPPLIYVIISAILTCLNVDFGRGDNYPYIFMDLFSPAGLFGFSKEPPIFGAVYWILFFALITATVGLTYYQIKSKRQK